MGIRVEIGGIDYEALDYEVQEEATALGVHDSAQSVGSFSVSIRLPEEFSDQRSPKVSTLGNEILSPLVTPDRVVYNPSDYTVEGITITDDPLGPGAGVRITRISTQSGYVPFRLQNLDQFISRDYSNPRTSVRLRVRGGPFYWRTAVAPPAPPDTELPSSGTAIPFSGLWVTREIPNPAGAVGYSVPELNLFSDDGVSASYPVSLSPDFAIFGGVSVEISAVAVDHDAPLNVSPGTVPTDTFVPTGDNPYVGDSETVVPGSWQKTFRWGVERDNSPTYVDSLLVAPGADPVSQSGGLLLEGQDISLIDTLRGVTSGKIISATATEDGVVSLQCESGLSTLNSYRVDARPSDLTDYGSSFEGTLEEAVRYYAGLAGCPYVYVDPSVRDRRVSYPGWSGESWFYLKQLAASQGCEISFIRNYPVFRPVRGRELPPGRWLDRRVSTDPGDVSSAIEVVNLRARSTSSFATPVISPSSPGAQVVDLGTYDEASASGTGVSFTLDLDIDTTFVYSPDRTDSFTLRGQFWICTEDGRYSELAPSASVFAMSDPENPRRAYVHVDTDLIPTFSNFPDDRIFFARPDDQGNLQPGITLYGQGVSTDPETVTIPTGARTEDVRSEVGVRVESPFLSDSTLAIRAGLQALREYAGSTISLEGEISRVLPRGDTGVESEATYAQVQDLLTGVGYEGVLDAIPRSVASSDDYEGVQEALQLLLGDKGMSQEFGNVAGARLWDEGTRRWFRIRSASVRPDTISLRADDDLTIGEAFAPWEEAGLTYGEVQEDYVMSAPGMELVESSGPSKITYGQLEMMGVVRA